MECPTTNMVSHPGRGRDMGSSQIRGQGKEPSLSARGVHVVSPSPVSWVPEVHPSSKSFCGLSLHLLDGVLHKRFTF